MSALPPTAVQALKLADCYEYQACETDDWSECEACAVVNAIRRHAITRVPGYAEAAWDAEA